MKRRVRCKDEGFEFWRLILAMAVLTVFSLASQAKPPVVGQAFALTVNPAISSNYP